MNNSFVLIFPIIASIIIIMSIIRNPPPKKDNPD